MDNFQSFTEYSGIKKSGIFTPDEERNMAYYSLNEFKNLVREDLLESEGYVDDSLLEQAYSYYEISSFYESKSDWISEDSNMFHLESDDHIIFLKEDQVYVISKSTFNAINEWDFGWGRAKAAFNKVVSASKSLAASAYNRTKSAAAWAYSGAKKIASNTVSYAKKTWDTISDGAKKAWEFVKTVPSLVKKIVSDMSWKEKLSLIIGALGALCGLIGSAIRAATVIGGICMIIAGGLDVYEGFEKYSEAEKKLEKINMDLGKNSALIGSALPNIGVGSVLISLGIKDILDGSTKGLIDPKAGSVSFAIKATALKASRASVAKMGHVLTGTTGKYIKTVIEKITKSPKLASKLPKSIGSITVMAIGNAVLGKVIGWVVTTILKSAKATLSGLDFLLNVPSKISQSIESMRKNSTSVIGKIISGGLEKLIKPVTDATSKAIKKYLSPSIAKAKAWIDYRLEAYNLCIQTLNECEKSDGKIKTQTVPVTKAKQVISKPKVPPAKEKDLGLIKKIEKGGKQVKESTDYDNVYNFEQFLKLT